MKLTKRIFAMLMVVAIMLAVTLTANAATNKANLTVSGDNLAGKTVTVINIFSDNSQTTDEFPNYVLRDAWKPFFASKLGVLSTDPDISTEAYRYVVAMEDDSPELIDLAEDAREYYVTESGRTPATVTFLTPTSQTADANGNATFANLNAGMYLVLPEGGSTSATRATDAMIVTIRNSNVNMNMKSEYPTVEKKVKPAGSAVDFADATSAQVGDYVQFQLTSIVPEMSDYDSYIFNFKDTLSNGLTFVKDAQHPMSLTINTETLVENDGVDDNDYTFTQNGQSFAVAINDLKALEADVTKDISVGDTITLTYYAELNSNAVVGTAGNANSATVEYSNDPTSDGTGESAPDVSKVYTYEIEINKFSMDNTDEVPLAGAKFELYDTDETSVGRAPIQLVATATANTYRVATPQEIANNAVEKITEVITPVTGKIKIDGLDIGTYYLKETEAPTGYNQLAREVTVVISADDSATAAVTESDYASVYYTIDGTQNANANDNEVKIENRPGSMLPTTGGIGTIGLTVAGVALVIFGVLFTSRKKKAKKAE